MEKINKEELRERLIGEGYLAEYGLDRTVDNLLNLEKLDDKRAYEMLVKWMQTGKVDKFEPIEGIDYKFLKDTLNMKKPAIILAYGMLLYDPKRNALFLKREATKRMLFTQK